MIDTHKTELLRKRLQQEKTENDFADSKGSSSLVFLLNFIAKYFAFYGAQWLILTKFKNTPFNLLETIIIYFAVIGIFANKK